VSIVASLGCSSDEPKASDGGQVTASAAGSQASNTAGSKRSEPKCEEGVWQLASGFLVAQHVDYVADRASKLTASNEISMDEPRTFSSAGMPCATARDVGRCRNALRRPSSLGRHLVTTAGDSVKLWPATAARNLLGLLDTRSEALWWVIVSQGYVVPCDATVREKGGGYTVEGVEQMPGCYPIGTVPPKLSVFVNSADGMLSEVPLLEGVTSVCQQL
jgi:hypothetical protein